MLFKRLLFLIACFNCVVTEAQQHLSQSRQTSPYTYIYTLTDEETLQLYKHADKITSEKYLHTLKDSFPTSEEMPALPASNYIKVYVAKNELKTQLFSISNVRFKFINNGHDLVVALHTPKGELIKDATVKSGKRTLNYDGATQSWRLNNYDRKGVLQILYKGVLTCQLVEHEKQPSFLESLLDQYRRTARRLRLRKRKYHSYYNNAYYRPSNPGFIAFSKPKYKPLDTVKLKAFILDKKKAPLNKPLLLRFKSQYHDDLDTILATIHPYRPGAYEYQFVLADSLDLFEDSDYHIAFETTNSREKEDNDRKILMSGTFHYEEYELNALNFSARTDKKTTIRNEQVALYVKATDENDLPVMDGRINVWVTTSGNGKYYTPVLFIPDTLWQHSQQMDALGETKIVLPDSIFPKASINYEIHCQFLNSNNESHTKEISQEYEYDTKAYKFELTDDSLHLTFMNAGKSETQNVWLYAQNSKGDTLEARQVILPATIKINPFAEVYSLENGKMYDSYGLKRESADLQNVSSRTRDSVHIQINNPKKLNFWYTILAGKKVIRRGYGNSLQFNEAAITSDNYFVSIQYIWADKPEEQYFSIAYLKNNLTIDITAPSNIYPGQKTHIGIAVTDVDNRPVADADITSYAFTSKFSNPDIPKMPYLGKQRYMVIKPINDYIQNELPFASKNLPLDWEKSGKKLGLDSIQYFRFRHPSPLFRFNEPARDSTTQIAPFVMGKGNFIPVEVIYINELPVYFRKADQLLQYSFAIKPGWNKLALRTPYQLITWDSIFIQTGVKNILSIDTASMPESVTKSYRPRQFTRQELNVLERYMIRVDNTFDEHAAYIKQNNHIYLLNKNEGINYSYYNSFLAGPLTGAPATLTVKSVFEQDFNPEGAYLFNITKGLIKQKQTIPSGMFINSLFDSAVEDLTGRPLKENDIDSLLNKWQELYLRQHDLSYENNNENKADGRLNIHLQNDTLPWRDQVLQYFLFRYDDPLYIKSKAGTTPQFKKLEAGLYRLLVLLTDNRYFITDSISVKEHGLNYQEIAVFPFEKDNKMIADLRRETRSVTFGNNRYRALQNIAAVFNNGEMKAASLTRTISGILTDQSGETLIGAHIKLNGTPFGTITDENGFFKLAVTPKGILLSEYVGFITHETRLTAEDYYKIQLEPSEKRMQEIVVTSLGIKRKQVALGYATSLTGSAPGIQIRGINSIAEGQQPLIIVDGVPFSGKLGDLKPENIKSINVLKDATALYGSAGAAGVIIITTGKAVADNNKTLPGATSPANSLRTNFHDDAFWQPRLHTDANGKTGFDVTFPDDITNWRAFVIAMTDHKQSGIAETKIRSFKTLSANLTLPGFAVEGDTINVIGKMMNYMPDSVTVNRTFTVNDSIYRMGSKGIKNAAIDTVTVCIPLKDSIRFKYTTLKDGYFDGEERTIPIAERGTTETDGVFTPLYKDTAFTYTPSHTEPVKVYATAAILPILQEEIKHVQRYEYLCNEQLASKLKAFLLEKKINPHFQAEGEIYYLIRTLNKRKKDALWGWWENTPVSVWVSRHVIEALLMAEEMGYETELNKQIPTDYLVYQLNSGKENDSIGCMLLLADLKAKIDYKSYIDSFKLHSKVSAYDNLRITMLQQRTGLPVNIPAVLADEQHSLFGNPYWGEDSWSLSDNSIQQTLMVYKILRKQGGYENMLQKIRGYFLEQRKTGYWRNTYESSLILETILADVMAEQMGGHASLTINNTTITQFPYTIELKAAPLSISKKGALPVYFTAYQQYHNRQPEKLSKPFSVSSSFNKSVLKAGEPATLTVEVNASESGEYVMVEIPIPAGCSYNDKPQSWQNNEVHREYQKTKVSIFCSRLEKGKHIFTISLLPRYTGNYFLNPAKVELQYFPVFMGREALKKVDIR